MDKGRGTVRSRQRASLPRILVVDANPGYRSVISHLVELAGGQFESVAELGQARRQLDGDNRYDMIILGTSADSPVTPGEVANLRSVAQTPLIVLAESYDETEGTLEIYKAGADQVLPKPFAPDALIGAIEAEIRRPGPTSVVPMATRIELGNLVFDAQKRLVTGKQGDATLTKREWQLLSFFLASPNKFFQASDVVSQAWGADVSLEQLRSYITRLRQKLSPFKPACELVTEKGKGYCMVVEHLASSS